MSDTPKLNLRQLAEFAEQQNAAHWTDDRLRFADECLRNKKSLNRHECMIRSLIAALRYERAIIKEQEQTIAILQAGEIDKGLPDALLFGVADANESEL